MKPMLACFSTASLNIIMLEVRLNFQGNVCYLGGRLWLLLEYQNSDSCAMGDAAFSKELLHILDKSPYDFVPS